MSEEDWESEGGAICPKICPNTDDDNYPAVYIATEPEDLEEMLAKWRADPANPEPDYSGSSDAS